MKRITVTHSVYLAALWCLGFALAPLLAHAQEPLPTPLLRASASDELPLPAWGPFARSHVGPCCLVNRLLLQQFAFPIVISQQRDETLVQATRNADGKIRVHQQQLTLLRRAMGLSPVRANEDDRVDSLRKQPLNRRTTLTEADREALLWHAQINFDRATVVQPVAQLPDAMGKLQPPQDWGAADATIDYFPAFGDSGGDGLLIRISLTNRSDAAQIYCVDLLGGMDTQSDDFPLKDLILQPDAQGLGIAIQHPKCAAVFALAATAGQIPLRCYRVDGTFFTPAGAIAKRGGDGALLPNGMVTALADGAHAANAVDAGKPVKFTGLKPQTRDSKADASWALARLSEIAVAPGQTVTLFYSVGVGKDPETARDSAQTLLGIAEDAAPNGKLREGAYTLAQQAHRTAMFAPDDPAISQLIAQSLGNVPLVGGRRIGVPSRQSTQGRVPGLYQATLGGMIALAYTSIQPDYAAAELNAWFQSRSNSDVSAPNPIPFPPTNLFALWDLVQSTRNHDLATRVYPFARRRYVELLAAGRQNANEPLLGWPDGVPADLFIPSLGGDAAKTGKNADIPTPEYASYVIRSAILLRALAKQTNRSATEIDAYTTDIAQTTTSLNDHLWNANRGLYMPAMPLNPDTVADLLPLISGTNALPPDRRAALLHALTNPATFWSPYGVRQVAKNSLTYRSGAPNAGAIRFGINWLLWKALLDLGETEIAHRLAANVVTAYKAAYAANGGCPEWLDGDTGEPGGAQDYSGDASGLIPLYAAYHVSGAVTTGWNIQMLDRRYDNKADILHVAFRNLEPTQASALICVLATPGKHYKVEGTMSAEVVADADGVVTLNAPKDGTTQAIDILPLAGTAK